MSVGRGVKRGTTHGHGPLVPAVDGRCGACGGSGFVYSNGHEVSACGVRGYRCMQCGAVKPERKPERKKAR